MSDPNPRLAAWVAAARRGARVRVLLDELFDDADDARGNRATADYLNALAVAEGLDLAARLGNPTDGGLHAKLALVRVGGTPCCAFLSRSAWPRVQLTLYGAHPDELPTGKTVASVAGTCKRATSPIRRRRWVTRMAFTTTDRPQP